MAMKKYELTKAEGKKWELYFWDNEFSQWVFIREYEETATISDIYDFIKSNNLTGDIVQLKFEI